MNIEYDFYVHYIILDFRSIDTSQKLRFLAPGGNLRDFTKPTKDT